MPGGQPSTIAPIAGPWLSPQVVTRKRWPKGVVGHSCFYAARARRSNPRRTRIIAIYSRRRKKMALATHQKDLRTGRSLWMSRPSPSVATKRLASDLSTDVLIIGAGVSGAMVAEQLTEAGLDVVIVDRRGPLQGSTPASTALLQYEIDEPLSKLSKAIGQEKAQRIWRRSEARARRAARARETPGHRSQYRQSRLPIS